MRAAWLLAGLLAVVSCRPAPQDAARPADAGDPASLATAPVATSSQAIAYRLRFEAPSTHYLHLEARLAARGRDRLTIMMPVWTPGSYLVREYARHVDRLRAHAPDGRALEVRKVRKNRFEITLGGAPQVILRYRVYAREPSVRTNYLDPDYMVVIPAATFFADVDHLDVPYEVTVDLPEGYGEVAVALERTPSGVRRAPNYDALVDAPFVAGQLRRYPFEVAGAAHELIHLGGEAVWPDDKTLEGTRAVTEAIAAFWGEVPYDRYLFLNVINEAGGGLEHRASTLMMTKRHQAHTGDGYRKWLGLVAHEHFHTWNGKRLRPEAHGPFDFENEVYTEALWFVEGLTSYYDDLLVRRADLMTEAQYLKFISDQIKRLEATPGRLEQPLSRSSYDAWIELYRHDASSRNTTVSYYNKGAVVGFVVDMAIRRSTGGLRSLDDVMRRAYGRYSGARGFSNEALYAVFEEVGGAQVRALVERLVHTTDPIEYGEALAWVGLRFKPAKAEPGPEATKEKRVEAARERTWLGAKTSAKSGRTVITEVVVGGPAEQAGLQVDDELVAVAGLRIGSKLSSTLGRYAPGDEVEVLLTRRGAMRTVSLSFGVRPSEAFELQIHPSAGRRAKDRRQRWLRPVR